jgi:hypothetical protein
MKTENLTFESSGRKQIRRIRIIIIKRKRVPSDPLVICHTDFALSDMFYNPEKNGALGFYMQ